MSSERATIWAAVIGLVATCLTGAGAVCAVLKQQDSANDAERAAAMRELRADAYTQFVSAMDAISEFAGASEECRDADLQERKLLDACSTLTVSQASSVLRLRAAHDKVLVYGSPAAVSLADGFVGSALVTTERLSNIDAALKRMEFLDDAAESSKGSSARSIFRSRYEEKSKELTQLLLDEDKDGLSREVYQTARREFEMRMKEELNLVVNQEILDA